MNICIVGGGLMGSGIGQVTAQANLNVTIIDITDESLEISKKE